MAHQEFELLETDAPTEDAAVRIDPAALARIQMSPRLSDMVYAALRDAIVRQLIRPNAWLREEALARHLGVSRLPVRDALGRLVADGLAVRVPYKGVKTIMLPLEDVEDLLQTRALLEARAAGIAAGRISDEDLARLRELLPLTDKGADGRDVAAIRDSNREFHFIIIRATGRQHLIHMLTYLWGVTPINVLNTELTSDERKEEAVSDLTTHTRIVDALQARDAKSAHELVEQHVLNTLEYTLKVVRRVG